MSQIFLLNIFVSYAADFILAMQALFYMHYTLNIIKFTHIFAMML